MKEETIALISEADFLLLKILKEKRIDFVNS